MEKLKVILYRHIFVQKIYKYLTDMRYKYRSMINSNYNIKLISYAAPIAKMRNGLVSKAIKIYLGMNMYSQQSNCHHN